MWTTFDPDKLGQTQLNIYNRRLALPEVDNHFLISHIIIKQYNLFLLHSSMSVICDLNMSVCSHQIFPPNIFLLHLILLA
jgi:hypothetical protein